MKTKILTIILTICILTATLVPSFTAYAAISSWGVTGSNVAVTQGESVSYGNITCNEGTQNWERAYEGGTIFWNSTGYIQFAIDNIALSDNTAAVVYLTNATNGWYDKVNTLCFAVAYDGTWWLSRNTTNYGTIETILSGKTTISKGVSVNFNFANGLDKAPYFIINGVRAGLVPDMPTVSNASMGAWNTKTDSEGKTVLDNSANLTAQCTYTFTTNAVDSLVIPPISGGNYGWIGVANTNCTCVDDTFMAYGGTGYWERIGINSNVYNIANAPIKFNVTEINAMGNDAVVVALTGAANQWYDKTTTKMVFINKDGYWNLDSTAGDGTSYTVLLSGKADVSEGISFEIRKGATECQVYVNGTLAGTVAANTFDSVGTAVLGVYGTTLDVSTGTLGFNYNIEYYISYKFATGILPQHDPAAKEGKSFTEDYNNYITYRTSKPLASLPLTMETEIYIPESVYNDSVVGEIAGNYNGDGKYNFDWRILGSGYVQLVIRQGFTNKGEINLHGVRIQPNTWTHLAVVITPEPDLNGVYWVTGYQDGVKKTPVQFGYNFRLNNAKDAWIADPVDPSIIVCPLVTTIGASNIVLDPQIDDGETVVESSLYMPHNQTCFKGRMKSVAFFDEAKTDEQIASDFASGVDSADSSLMGYYKFADGVDCTPDLSLADNDLIKYISWMNEEELEDNGIKSLVKGVDYDYSMVVIGDTQILNRADNGTIDTDNYDNSVMTGIYKWIAANKDAMNIQFVAGLGDITDDNSAEAWANANYSYENYLLNNGIRFSQVIGNHDHSAEYNTMDYFNNPAYSQNVAGNFWKDVKGVDNVNEDSYQLLEIGDVKYCIISLGFGVTDDVLEWAGNVCDKYRDRNVIICTHSYLYNDGSLYNPVDPDAIGYWRYGDDETKRNGGQGLWDKLVNPHSNITMVLCGHVSADDVVINKRMRDNGSYVTEMLINPQGIDALDDAGGNGHGKAGTANDYGKYGLHSGNVSILYFKADGTAVAHRNYSTLQGMYYGSSNQVDELNINVVNDPCEYQHCYGEDGYCISCHTHQMDVNGDGIFNLLDLVKLKKHIANIEDVILKVSGDFDSSGLVDSQDLILMIQALLKK